MGWCTQAQLVYTNVSIPNPCHHTFMFSCMDTHTNLYMDTLWGFQVWTHNKLYHVWIHQLCMEFSCTDTHTQNCHICRFFMYVHTVWFTCMGFACMDTHTQMLCMDTHTTQAAFPNGPQSGPSGAHLGPNFAQLGPNRGPHGMLLGYIRFIPRFIMYGHTIRFSCIGPLLGLSSMGTHSNLMYGHTHYIYHSHTFLIYGHTTRFIMYGHPIIFSCVHPLLGLSSMDTHTKLMYGHTYYIYHSHTFLMYGHTTRFSMCGHTIRFSSITHYDVYPVWTHTQIS